MSTLRWSRVAGTVGAGALLVLLTPPGPCVGAPGAAPPAVDAAPADIELRKSFRFVRRANRRPQSPGPSAAAGVGPGAGATAADGESRRADTLLDAAAAALGEPLRRTGTLHLPGIGGGALTLEGARTPVLETAAGHRLIIDRERAIGPAAAEQIALSWPGFAVVQPAADADLRELIGSVLAASGYDTVMRSAPLVFGQGASIRYTPDFVVLRTERDLLAGETRAISVLDGADALPDELRELAAGARVRVVELTARGNPVGADRAPWRDPTGRVTTVEGRRALRLLEEIAVAAGLAVERGVPPADAPGAPPRPAGLRVSRGASSALVLEPPQPHAPLPPDDPAAGPLTLNGTADLPQAVGALANRLGLTAIGPTVEFFRAPRPGTRPRFVISVPGWLLEVDGRRLLVTGAALPTLVRLYLTREGIDICEYRVRTGR